MAKQHIDELAEELIRCGIFTNANKVEDGSWTGDIDTTRVYNHDETPQFINYGVDGTARNVYYCGKGERCVGITAENRECVTISPMVSLGGEVAMCHVIFASSGIKANMAPKEAVEKIPYLLVSSTDNGFQTGKSCDNFYKMFDQYLTEKEVKRPVVVLTDGHSSRFDLDVLRICQEKEIYQFVSPPDTTGLLQPLDQINSKLHTSYRDAVVENIFVGDHINRETFMIMLADIWQTWASLETVQKAFKKCGITGSGLDIDHMQRDKFDAADLVTEEGGGQTPAATARKENLTLIKSPRGLKKGSAAYWKAKFQASQDNMNALLDTPISPEEIPEFRKIDKFKPTKSKNFRITQTSGSLAGKDILKKREELEAKDELKRKSIEEKRQCKEKGRLAFLKCKDGCVCIGPVCEAEGLKQCTFCESIMKSQCSKAQCKLAAGGKPMMIAPKHVTSKPKVTKARKTKESKYDDIYDTSDSSDDSDNLVETSTDDDNEDREREEDPSIQLKEFWSQISPPVPEENLKGEWFVAIYKKGGKELMYVGRAKRRFLEEEGGCVTHMELSCLKPRVGLDNVLFGYPSGQEDDFVYAVEDVIGGPLSVDPVPRKNAWKVNNLDKMEAFFQKVAYQKRAAWLSEFQSGGRSGQSNQ